MSWRTIAALALAAPVGLVFVPRPEVANAAEPLEEGQCVTVTNEVRYRNYGYDHIVHLDNACDVPVECTVTTDSNPNGVVAEVPPETAIELLLFRGSPARTFTSRVDCAQ